MFEPNRQNNENKHWTNNNAESINNIFKISVDWKPKHTKDLIHKLSGVTDLHFMDYRSSLHDTGNYQLTNEERIYRVHDAVWRCKSKEEKKRTFPKFSRGLKMQAKFKILKIKRWKIFRH